jgi:transaldolase
MKFFLDTANLAEIQEVASWGILDGVTTNPSLIAKENVTDPRQHIRRICEIVNGPVSAEVVGTMAEEMVREGRELAQIHPQVMVKIPCLIEGLKAIRQLAREGIKVNTTLIFSVPQALLAAKAGATVVSPFIGRLDDISHPGLTLIEHLRQVFDTYGFQTGILAASIRHPLHVVEAALLGADIVTLPFKVMEQLMKHPLTDIGLERFLKDWERVSKPAVGRG